MLENQEMKNANVENEDSGDSPPNEGSGVENEGNSDESDKTYDAESEDFSDNESDIQYFLDVDNLSDACSSLEDGEVDAGFGLNVDLGDFSAYAMMIFEDYTSYMNAKSQGNVVEYENLGDNEILDGQEFLKGL
ncbi:hypothetical protein ACH5RR_025003 [Cinchona calisaya]|uniref:Uncharacterized protein n=1 Tax=Cinchona calisaya TaxID=153742 RepID=A0ABD2YYE6_9GENT